MASNPSPYGGGSGTTGVVPPAGDIGGTTGTPTVTGEHFTAPLPVINGGTGQATQQLAINALAGAQTNHQALAGDGTNMTVRALLAADLPALNALTAPAASVAFNSQKITGLANGTAATDAAAFGQIGAGAALDATAAHFQPEGLATAGANSLGSDSGHVHPANAYQSTLLMPSGALVETIPRLGPNFAAGAALTSGTLFVTAIPLYKGLLVTNINFYFASGGSSFTHGWFVLLDSSRVVQGVTADKTSGGWTASAVTTIAIGTPYTIPAAGLYYIGVMAVGTGPTVFQVTANSNIWGGVATTAPALCGSSSTGQTTPPSLGATMGALTPSAGSPFWGYVS